MGWRSIQHIIIGFMRIINIIIIIKKNVNVRSSKRKSFFTSLNNDITFSLFTLSLSYSCAPDCDDWYKCTMNKCNRFYLTVMSGINQSSCGVIKTFPLTPITTNIYKKSNDSSLFSVSVSYESFCFLWFTHICSILTFHPVKTTARISTMWRLLKLCSRWVFSKLHRLHCSF